MHGNGFRRRLSFLLGLASLLGLADALARPVAAAAQGTPLGPLFWEEGSPLQRISMTPGMEIADPVRPGTVAWEVWLGYSNIFEQDSTRTHVLFLDLERLITTATLRWGVREGLEAGARLTFESTGPGILDTFISEWHQMLGLGNANRERYPAFRYDQVLKDDRGNIRLRIPRRTLGLEDVRLFAKWRIAGGPAAARALSLRAVARIPTAQNVVGGERSDLALLALGRTRWGAFHLHGMAGVSTVRASSDLADIMSPAGWYLTLALERPLLPCLSGVVEVAAATAKIRGFNDPEIDGSPVSVLFGLVGTAGHGWRWEAGFQEDIPADKPSIDFTLGLGLGRSF
ncbi:MAG: DUF3187 family protein [Gemmatimonadota bacterium]